MNKNILSIGNLRSLIAGAAIAWVGMTAGYVCRAQSAPTDLSPDVQEVLTLSKQHMDDSVITNYIMSAGKAYKLSADDIIYLNSQGVSQPVISCLLSSANNASAQPTAASATPPPAADGSAPGSATPPPLDAGSPPPDQSQPAPSESEPMASAPPPMSAPPMAAGFQDNFFTDGGLNPSQWQTQTPLLGSLAAANGAIVSPILSFSPSGLQMSGIGGPGQFMGIQSSAAFSAPFSFTTTVSGMSQDAIPFEIYLVSADLQQWVSVAGHLGGRGHAPGHVTFWGPFGGGVRVPVGGGSSPDYGVWVNHTGTGQPLSALGNKLFDHPIAGVPYTIQVSVGPDGMASVTLLDPNHLVLGSETVPVGTGPFYAVLAGRNGPTYAEWQSAQLAPAGPPVVAEQQPAPDVAVPPTPTLDYFQSQLSPYGSWVNLPGYGLCWQPAVSVGWRPYYDGGHWQYTDAGYFWQSDYPWGDIAFHYGRWAYTPTGWAWVPGYDYAPSWVVWRHDDADGFVGWAPLPPGAVFVDGGWAWNGQPVGPDFAFGLGVGFFSFVAYDHFWEPNFRLWIVPHDRAVFAFGHSVIINHYAFDHGRFVNTGIGRSRMEAFTHRDFRPVPMAQVRHDEEMHNAFQRQNDVHNFHPGAQPNAWGHGPGAGPQHGMQPNGAHGQPNYGHQPQGNNGGHGQGGGNGHQDQNGH
jgi:hypothetical protein